MHSAEHTHSVKDQLMLIGLRPVLEAVRSGKEFDKVFLQKGLKGDLQQELKHALRDSGVPFLFIPEEKIRSMSRGNHQGVIAFLSPVTFSNVDEIVESVFRKGQSPLLLMLDGVTDVRNFGAVCRSAECFGAHAVIIPEKGAARINEDAVKSSAGALLNIPICRERSLTGTARRLKDSGIELMACTEKGSELTRSANLSGPICIIMGAEDKGISTELLKISNKLLRIPMSGKTASLNVSVAAGVILYESLNQRLQERKKPEPA